MFAAIIVFATNECFFSFFLFAPIFDAFMYYIIIISLFCYECLHFGRAIIFDNFLVATGWNSLQYV